VNATCAVFLASRGRRCLTHPKAIFAVPLNAVAAVAVGIEGARFSHTSLSGDFGIAELVDGTVRVVLAMVNHTSTTAHDLGIAMKPSCTSGAVGRTVRDGATVLRGTIALGSAHLLLFAIFRTVT